MTTGKISKSKMWISQAALSRSRCVHEAAAETLAF